MIPLYRRLLSIGGNPTGNNISYAPEAWAQQRMSCHITAIECEGDWTGGLFGNLFIWKKTVVDGRLELIA